MVLFFKWKNLALATEISSNFKASFEVIVADITAPELFGNYFYVWKALLSNHCFPEHNSRSTETCMLFY